MNWRRVKHFLIVTSQPYCRRSSTPPTCHSLLNRKQIRHIACDPRHGANVAKTNMLSGLVSNPSVLEHLPLIVNSTRTSPSIHCSRHDNVLRQRHIGNKGALSQRHNAGKTQAPSPPFPRQVISHLSASFCCASLDRFPSLQATIRTLGPFSRDAVCGSFLACH